MPQRKFCGIPEIQYLCGFQPFTEKGCGISGKMKKSFATPGSRYFTGLRGVFGISGIIF